jgi:hypothetical protein
MRMDEVANVGCSEQSTNSMGVRRIQRVSDSWGECLSCGGLLILP